METNRETVGWKDKRGRLENPDGYGRKTGQCGDTIEMFLSVLDGAIRVVAFNTDGCQNTTVCANVVALLAEGKAIEEAWELSPEDVANFLGQLPAEAVHCAELAVGTLYLALSDFQKNQQKK